ILPDVVTLNIIGKMDDAMEKFNQMIDQGELILEIMNNGMRLDIAQNIFDLTVNYANGWKALRVFDAMCMVHLLMAISFQRNAAKGNKAFNYFDGRTKLRICLLLSREVGCIMITNLIKEGLKNEIYMILTKTIGLLHVHFAHLAVWPNAVACKGKYIAEA
ncbi:hypothetical protein ACJX0J_014776, partial [Zea mays]